jgi:peptide/nickel transport system permease protein
LQRSIIVRLLSIIPVVLVVSFATFTMIELIPGDAASIRLGEEATPEEVEQLRKDLGLDKGFLERYGDWLVNAVQGDLGTSLRSNRPVLEQIRDRLTPTIWLGAGAVVLAIVVAIPIGVISATAPGSKRDIVGTYFATLGIALPEFVIGVILVLVFAVRLGWFPTSGWVDPLDDPVQGLKHLILPWIAMAGVSTASLSRMIRSSMIEVLGHDYCRSRFCGGTP